MAGKARQFLQLMEKPDVDLIEGLSPAISIEQKATSHNPRLTVGTVTEIHDYLRLLFARAGTPYCPEHNQPLEAQTVSQMVDHVLALPAETKLMILAPVVANRKGEQLDLFAELRAQGFARVRVDGAVYEIDAVPKLAKTQKHNVDVVVDRLKVRDDMRQRLAESFETALRHAEGRAVALEMDGNVEYLFSAKFACPVCSYALQELEPRLFSFNNPMGACPKCDGLGVIQFFDPKRVVTQPAASLAGGAIRGWDRKNQFYFRDHRIAGCPLRLLGRYVVGRTAGQDPPADPLRFGWYRNGFPLPEREGNALRLQPQLRRHHVLQGVLGEISESYAERAEQALRAAWAEPGEAVEVRRRALEGLAYTDEAGVDELIESAYYNEDDLMRQSAIFAMGRTADRRWARAILTELGSIDAAMRYEAAGAAGELGLTSAVKPLIRLLDDADATVREASALALGKIGGREAKQALQACLEASDRALADAATDALDELTFNSEDSEAPLLEYEPSPKRGGGDEDEDLDDAYDPDFDFDAEEDTEDDIDDDEWAENDEDDEDEEDDEDDLDEFFGEDDEEDDFEDEVDWRGRR